MNRARGKTGTAPHIAAVTAFAYSVASQTMIIALTFLFGLRKRAATGTHEFDKRCAALDIEHRLTPPKSPQTNCIVERFIVRIEEVLQSHHFVSGVELEAMLHRYTWLYSQQLPQSTLRSKTPLQTIKDWHKIKPELFRKRPYHVTECNIYLALFSMQVSR